MLNLEFKISIKASKEEVWKVLWGEQTYKEWTGVFCEGSKAVTDWKEGSKVLFLNSENDGMRSMINRNIENEYMSIKHLGFVKKGVEEPLDEESKKWSGSLENYTLTETNGITELKVDMDVLDDYKEFFEKTFPQALNIAKELSEK